jgi:hypothetical protein
MNSFFHTFDLSIFKPHRAEAFEDFAQKLLAFSAEVDRPAERAVDIIIEDDDVVNDFCLQESIRKSNPLVFTRGSLDFLVAFIREGVVLDEELWDKLSDCVFSTLQSDLVEFGLHSLHFRVDLNTPNERIEAVIQLSRELFDAHSEGAHAGESVFPIGVLSTVIADDYQGYVDQCRAAEEDSESQEGDQPFTQDQLNELLLLNLRQRSPQPEQSYEDGLRHMLSHKGVFNEIIAAKQLPPLIQCQQIEVALMALVYNYGYRLKTEYLSNYDVKEEVSPIIDRLLAPLEAGVEFAVALKRQILINLFSAFPKGLEMFNTRPEELQGVMLDPILLEHPYARYFEKTLSGPLALFTPGESCSYQHRATQLIDFLAEAGYPIHMDIAQEGLLGRTRHIEKLFQYEPTLSETLDRAVSTDFEGRGIPKMLGLCLLDIEHLVQLSDRSVLKLFEVHAADINATSIRHQAEYNPQGQRNFTQLFKQRPHLVEPVLDVFARAGHLNDRSFKALGFGERELRLLGDRAPDELKENVLAQDLGL